MFKSWRELKRPGTRQLLKAPTSARVKHPAFIATLACALLFIVAVGGSEASVGDAALRPPRTGQAICWDSSGDVINCAGSGYDAHYKAGIAWPSPRFSDNGDGTMTDRLTRLIWTKDAAAPTAGACTGYKAMDWTSALDYVVCLNSNNYLGHNDWRLPNINELESLVNAADSPQTWLSDKGFSDVQINSYWSSTTSAYQSDKAWTIGMSDGSANAYAKGNSVDTWVWPMRPGQSSRAPAPVWKTGQHIIYYPGDDGATQRGVSWPKQRFSANGNDTVTDNLTGLIWTKDAASPGPQACTPGTSMVMQEALNFIRCLNANKYLGKGDWRLPNRKELHTLTDYSEYGNALPAENPFIHVGGNDQGGYWSSTLDATIWHYDFAWSFGMDSGAINSSYRDYADFYVWPVRGGRSSNVSIGATGTPSAVQAGQEITYSIQIVNNGPNVATDVTLTGTLPSVTSFVSANSASGTCRNSDGAVTCGIGNLTKGASASASIRVTVLNSATGSITNIFNLSGSGLDPALSNNSATVTTTVNPSTCSYAVSPTSMSFNSSAGSGSVSVSSSGCNWTAKSNAPWITVTTGESGTGGGTVSYSVMANTGTSPRTGTITIAGQLFTVTQSNLAPRYVWEPLGPSPLYHNSTAYSGRITAIAIKPTNASIVYIGAAQGGVWKTTNSGKTWTPLTDNQASLAMGALAIAPSNPNVIYAGTGEANFAPHSYFGTGILKSADGGSTWVPTGQSQFYRSSISKIIVHPSKPNILWAASTLGTSGDGGYNWVLSLVTTGVSKSVDGGNTWTRVLASKEVSPLPFGVTDLVMDPSNPNVLYAGVYSGGILKSTDGGKSWAILANGLPDKSTIGKIALAIDPRNPKALYATMARPIIPTPDGTHLGTYKSTDGGSSWTTLPEPQDLNIEEQLDDMCTLTGMPVGQCNYDLVINVSPDGGVWLGGIGLWRLDDGGNTWNNILGRSVHPDLHAIAFDKNGKAWVGTDGGAYVTPDNGATWFNKNTNLSITQFYPGVSLHPTKANFAIGGTQDNGTLLFTGKRSWQGMGEECDGGFSAIDYADPDNVWYVSCQFLSLYKTTDGGKNLVSAVTGIDRSTMTLTSFISPFVMCPNNSSVLLAGTDTVWKTTNGAALWSQDSAKPLKNGEVIRSLAFAPSDETCNTYFAGTGNNALIPGPGAGKSSVLRHDQSGWTDISGEFLLMGVSHITVDPTDANLVYVTLAAHGGPHIFRTRNALSSSPSWTAVDNGIPDVPVNDLLIDPLNPVILYAGTDTGIYRSNNSGTSWKPFMNGHPNVAVVDLVGNATTGAILSFTHGRGAFRLVNSPCYYIISPSSRSISAAGGLGGVSVTAPAGSCVWNATSNASWLTITSGGSGAGSGSVSYSVAVNSGSASRTGTITIAGQSFGVKQAGAL